MIRIREVPEDFRVDEEPLYSPTGEGGHTFVRVEKRLRTTEQVARDLARAAGVRPRDVGYAGRKDRAAVTTQWLSVPDLDPERALELEWSGVKVLEAARHPHKLRTGHLRSNRFEIVVRGVGASEFETARERLATMCRRGMPNRFGAQRFGRAGDNAERARRIFAGESSPRDRREARFLVSAWQSEVFNAVLERRPRPLDSLETGDIAVRHESGGLFDVEDAEAEAERALAFEISATGPLFGPRMRWPAGEVALRERAVMEAHGIDPENPKVPGVRARGGRRAIRVRPERAGLEMRGEQATLCFELPPGSYATVLLEELFGGFEEATGHDTPSGPGVS